MLFIILSHLRIVWINQQPLTIVWPPKQYTFELVPLIGKFHLGQLTRMAYVVYWNWDSYRSYFEWKYRFLNASFLHRKQLPINPLENWNSNKRNTNELNAFNFFSEIKKSEWSNCVYRSKKISLISVPQVSRSVSTDSALRSPISLANSLCNLPIRLQNKANSSNPKSKLSMNYTTVTYCPNNLIMETSSVGYESVYFSTSS